MKFKIVLIAVLIFSLFSVFSTEIIEEEQPEAVDNRPTYVTRFILTSDFTFSYHMAPNFGDGIYIGVSPGMIFEPKQTYKLYQPGINLDLGYNFATLPNRNLIGLTPNPVFTYNAVYVGLKFKNRFLINDHHTIVFDIFVRAFLGGKYKIIDGGRTCIGINVGYYYFFNEHIGLGTKIQYSYNLSGNYTGHNLNLFNIGVIWIV